MSDVTRILSQINNGDPTAAEQLLPLVYDELRKLAAAKMAQEKPGQTLNATALVHEASAPRRRGEGPILGQPRAFLYGRGRGHAPHSHRNGAPQQRVRHGGGQPRVHLASLDVADDLAAGDILALDEALERLAVEDADVSQVVKLRYFAGLTIEQTAAALGISVRTANRHWAYAKAWLFRELTG